MFNPGTSHVASTAIRVPARRLPASRGASPAAKGRNAVGQTALDVDGKVEHTDHDDHDHDHSKQEGFNHAFILLSTGAEIFLAFDRTIAAQPSESRCHVVPYTVANSDAVAEIQSFTAAIFCRPDQIADAAREWPPSPGALFEVSQYRQPPARHHSLTFVVG